MWCVAGAAAAAIAAHASVRPSMSGLYVDPKAESEGTCKGCGAPWIVKLVHKFEPTMSFIRNMNECSYCRRPFRS